jgi:hypothetical protein
MDLYIIPVDNIIYDSQDFSYEVKVQADYLMTFYSNNIIGIDILNDQFQFCFGEFHTGRIKEGNYFLLADSSVVEINKEEDLQKLISSKNKLLHFTFGFSQMFGLSLWFIKDNSANIPFGLFNDTQLNSGFPMTKNVMVSNAKGKYEIEIFSRDEFEKANEWLNYLSEFYIEDDSTGREYDGYNNLNSDINQNTNSFKRALTYLEQARSTSFLPAKIASYISVLETLFVVADSNTYKTPERTAVFLGGSLDDKKANFEIVKDAYSVRSSYVHGSDIGDKKNKKLDVISF